MSSISATTESEKHFYFSKVFQRAIPDNPIKPGRIGIIFCLLKQTRCWSDSQTTYSNGRHFSKECSDKHYIPFPFGNHRRELFAPRFRDEILSPLGVPPEEHSLILGKLFRGLDVAVHSDKSLVVVIFDVTVQFSADFDIHRYGDIITRLTSERPLEFAVKEDSLDSLGLVEKYALTQVNYHGMWDVAATDRVTGESFETYRIKFSPTTRSSIESLQKLRLDCLEEGTLKQNPSCCICFDAFVQNPDRLITPLPCAHHFHLDCIISWLEVNHLCPLCRYPMPSVEDEEPSSAMPSAEDGGPSGAMPSAEEGEPSNI